MIRSVDPDSPAERVGIRAGDMLLAYRGERTSAQFTEELPLIYKKIADTPIGSEVAVAVARGGAVLEFTITTEERGASSSDEMEFESWGFTARGITRELAREFSLPDNLGVMVAGVKPNGAAFHGQLFPGDRIVAAENEPVGDLEELRDIYRSFDDARTDAVLLTVMRRHSRRWILIEPSYEN